MRKLKTTWIMELDGKISKTVWSVSIPDGMSGKEIKELAVKQRPEIVWRDTLLTSCKKYLPIILAVAIALLATLIQGLRR